MAQNSNPIPLSLTLMRLMFKCFSPLIPGIMGQYAYNLWLTPLRTKAPEPEQPFIKKAKAGFITVDGLKIRTWAWGEGPTVLFIHGWGGRGTQISGYIDGLTKAGFQVMSFDMPAHGESQGKRTNGFSVANTASEIIKHIDNLHSVVTHSFGGLIFLLLYTPSLNVKSMVMFCPPINLATAFTQFCDTLQLPKNVQDVVIKKLKANFGDDLFDRISFVNNGAHITQPLMIVHDKQDDIVPYENGQQVVNSVKQGSLYSTNGLGHRKVLFDKTVNEHVMKYILETV